MDEQFRFTDRVARRLQQSGEAARQRESIEALEGLRWLVGSWALQVRILATPLSPERTGSGTAEIAAEVGGGWLAIRKTIQGNRDAEVAFLTYSPVGGEWTLVWLVAWRNTFTAYSPGWDGNRLTFTTALARFYGEPESLRVHLTRLSDAEFTLVYEGGRGLSRRMAAHRRIPLPAAALRGHRDSRISYPMFSTVASWLTCESIGPVAANIASSKKPTIMIQPMPTQIVFEFT